MEMNSYDSHKILQFPTVTSHFRPGYSGNLWLKIMAEGDEQMQQMSVDGQVSSVVSTASDSLEAGASSSNTSINHPNVS